MLRVLVVEDDLKIREMFLRFFRMKGYHAQEASDGEAAVALVSLQPFDVILMDVKMPKLDGLSATKQIRQAMPGMKIVLITGYSGSEDLTRLLVPGFVECLRKPCTFPELSAVLDRLCAQDAGSGPTPAAPPATPA